MMFSNTNKSTGKLCCIPHCPTNEAGNENTAIQFHPFPTDPILKEMWMERVRKAGNGNKWQPKNSSRLCSIHFSNSGKRDACDILPRYFGSKVYAHSGAISMDEVKVKLEVADDDDIEIHEEPLVEEFYDYSNTNVKQEPRDDIKSIEDDQSALMPQENQHSLLMPVSNIEEKSNLIKRDKPEPRPEPSIRGPPKKKRVITLTHNILKDNNYYKLVENENVSLKRQISVLEKSLAKANAMIKERKEIIMNLVKEVNKLQQQSDSHTEMEKENANLQESLMAANRRINEEKELIVNLTIENINLKKSAEYMRFSEANIDEKEKLAEQNQMVESLRNETESLCEDIKRLNQENDRLIKMCSVVENLKTTNRNQIAVNKSLSRSNEHLHANLSKTKERLALCRKDLETCKAAIKKQNNWSVGEIRYYTGFRGQPEFSAFCDIAKAIDPTPVSESYNISQIRQQILITLSRIKQGLSIEDLSHRYSMSQGTIHRVLNHWQNILSDSSFNWKICDSRSVIVKFFHEYFQDAHKKRLMCYFVGISPFGYVIFVSDLFLPSENRVEVLQSSGILSLLEEDFTIVALETNEFSDLGIELLESKPEEATEFTSHANKLLANVRRNKLFSHVLPFEQFSDIDVSNAWKISWYLQNYIDEF